MSNTATQTQNALLSHEILSNNICQFFSNFWRSLSLEVKLPCNQQKQCGKNFVEGSVNNGPVTKNLSRWFWQWCKGQLYKPLLGTRVLQNNCCECNSVQKQDYLKKFEEFNEMWNISKAINWLTRECNNQGTSRRIIHLKESLYLQFSMENIRNNIMQFTLVCGRPIIHF